MPLLRHYDNPGEARFVTFSTIERRKLLVHARVAEQVCRAIDESRRESGFLLWAYVLMPEHVHLVIRPMPGTKLGPIVGRLKWKSAMAIRRLHETRRAPEKVEFVGLRRKDGRFAFWQRRCFDRNCRNPQEVLQKIRYCHRNPVVRGLVDGAEDYRWSSYGWYMGKRDVPLIMDPMEL